MVGGLTLYCAGEGGGGTDIVLCGGGWWGD